MRIELKEILSHFPIRKKNSHKGTYGKVLNIAGSTFYTGAAILSSISALKVGCGYVTLACPDVITNSITSYTPDLTIFPLNSENKISITSGNIDKILKKTEDYDVVSIGSGLSDNSDTQKFVIDFINKNTKPIIIDADGLNAIATNSVKVLSTKTILTPHPKELSRLIKTDVAEIQSQREYYAIETSKKYNCITVLKGMNTIVTDGKRIYVNNSGNSSLAKAGTGDVLTGTIAGIAAQTKDMFFSACLGVYIHGLAGELASIETTEYGLLASELLNYLPKAIIKILN